MQDDQFKIEDESGDRKYFTIIPNYILNHSSAIDQALYLQMKRLAGENGTCHAGHRYFLEKMSIGYKAFKKSLQYLLSHNWITEAGKEKIMTNGGMQEITIYKINNLWHLNSEYFQGVAKSKGLKGAFKSSPKVLSKVSQGVCFQEHKKNNEERTIKKEVEATTKNPKSLQVIEVLSLKEDDYQFICELLAKYPAVDAVFEAKKMLAWLKDNAKKPNKRPRLRFANWLKKAEDYRQKTPEAIRAREAEAQALKTRQMVESAEAKAGYGSASQKIMAEAKQALMKKMSA